MLTWVGLLKERDFSFDCMEEIIWKPIKGYEDYYEVSNVGMVRGKPRSVFNPGSGAYINLYQGYLRPSFDKDCYLDVTLTINGVSSTQRIHRLVAIAFLDNPNDLPIVGHQNGVRWDNRVENLKWCTQSENILDSFLYGRKKVSGRPVNQLTLEGQFVKRFETIRQVEQDGFCSKKVNAVVVGKRNMAGGYKWEYAQIDLEKHQ